MVNVLSNFPLHGVGAVDWSWSHLRAEQIDLGVGQHCGVLTDRLAPILRSRLELQIVRVDRDLTRPIRIIVLNRDGRLGGLLHTLFQELSCDQSCRLSLIVRVGRSD